MLNYRIGVPKQSWKLFDDEAEQFGTIKLIGASGDGRSEYFLYYDIEMPDEETVAYLSIKYALINGTDDVERLAATRGLCND